MPGTRERRLYNAMSGPKRGVCGRAAKHAATFRGSCHCTQFMSKQQFKRGSTTGWGPNVNHLDQRRPGQTSLWPSFQCLHDIQVVSVMSTQHVSEQPLTSSGIVCYSRMPPSNPYRYAESYAMGTCAHSMDIPSRNSLDAFPRVSHS